MKPIEKLLRWFGIREHPIAPADVFASGFAKYSDGRIEPITFNGDRAVAIEIGGYAISDPIPGCQAGEWITLPSIQIHGVSRSTIRARDFPRA